MSSSVNALTSVFLRCYAGFLPCTVSFECFSLDLTVQYCIHMEILTKSENYLTLHSSKLTIQYKAHNTVQYCTVQYSTVFIWKF